MEYDKELEEIRKRKLEEMMKMGNSEDDKMKVEAYSTEPITLTDANFQEEMSKDRVIMIDFWAEWCGPCRMVSPIIDELAKEYAGKISFGRLNVDENPMVAGAFQISSIPTLLIVKNGKVVDGIIGAVPKAQIVEKLKPYAN